VKVMVVYPHGLGDCILATPALRGLKARGDFVGFAMQERFRSAELFRHNPNVDELFWTQDVWNDFPNLEEGKASIMKECSHNANMRGYDRVVWVWHPSSGSKIIENTMALEVPLEKESLVTDVYIGPEDWKRADEITPEKPYGFVQTKTGVPAKDLPEGWGAAWLKEHHGLDRVVEVGKTFRHDEFNINVQFALMAKARAMCVPDSVFFHAACAMCKKIDLVYFAPGREWIYNRVRPIHDVEHNVVYEL